MRLCEIAEIESTNSKPRNQVMSSTQFHESAALSLLNELQLLDYKRLRPNRELNPEMSGQARNYSLAGSGVASPYP